MRVVLIFACFAVCYGSDCYWKGFPWCGLAFRCNSDHFMWYGMTGSCLLNFDKYCCPAGSQDVVLCEHKDFNGDCIVHDVGTKSCVTVDKNDWATSVNSMGHCVRIYEDDHCLGRSVALYPGSSGHNDLTSIGMNDKVSSVSKCYEYDHYQCGRSKRAINDKCQFAADILTIGFLAWRNRDTNNLRGPVSFYQANPRNGRTEVMEAVIYPHHLNTGTDTTPNSRTYARRMGNSNDDAGHILARNLGGSGSDVRNIFPQSANINRGVWSDVEGMVADYVRNMGGVRFTINLEYAHDDATRPYQIVYRIASIDGTNVFQMGDMTNP